MFSAITGLFTGGISTVVSKLAPWAIGFAIIAGLVAWAMWERGDAASARADSQTYKDSAELYMNGQDSAEKALAQAQANAQRDVAAVASDAQQQQAVTNTVTQIQKEVIRVPVSKACVRPDDRDRALYDGVRRAIGLAPGDPGPDSPGSAPGAAAGGHPATGPAAATQ